MRIYRLRLFCAMSLALPIPLEKYVLYIVIDVNTIFFYLYIVLEPVGLDPEQQVQVRNLGTRHSRAKCIKANISEVHKEKKRFIHIRYTRQHSYKVYKNG